MGRRKERRLAAISAAGRRVKLDLFAEPSGDLGGSSARDEVGGEIETKHHAASPNSPSTSGQKLDNPLLLLGQYSDDELEEGSKKRVKTAITEGCSDDHNDQVKGVGSEDMDINGGEYNASEEVKQQDVEKDGTSLGVLYNLESGDIRENDVMELSVSSREMDSAEQFSVPGNPVDLGTADMSLGWKMVMHEESNQYYYWNTETGETSWEVPEALLLASQLNPEQKILPVTEGMGSACLGHVVKSTSDVACSDSSALLTSCVSMGANSVSETKEVCGHVLLVNDQPEGCKGETLEVQDGVTGINQNELSSYGAVDDLLGNGNSIRTGAEEHVHERIANREPGTRIDISSRLVGQSESLLEKLMTLKGSVSHLQGHDIISKYIWELELRISDFKSLLSYGSSLLPFWEYSESQIKRLEVAVDDQICQFTKYAENEVDTHIKGDKSLESMEDAYEADGNEKKVVLSKLEISTTVQKDLQRVDITDNVTVAGHISSFGYPTSFGGDGSELNGGVVRGNDIHDEFSSKSGLHHEEDMDMDVDMEVDDALPSSSEAAQGPLGPEYFPAQEQTIQPNPPVEYSSLASEEGFTIPPPPDEEWIPPPPPDNEIIPPPPPPPDEPPASAYPPPPSYPETAEPISYAGQYNLSYPDSNFNYYGHTVAEVPSSSFYGLAEGHQVAAPHPPVYYDTVPNVYQETGLVIVNPVEPGAYYGVQNGMVPPVSVVSSIEPPGLQSGSDPLSYNTLASGQTGCTDAPAEADCSPLTNRKVDAPAAGCHAEIASAEAAFSSATIQAPATILVKDSVPMSSTNMVTGGAASTNSKVHTKASRAEKRTVALTSSLRSNKKVSSLVDKWKAAKEELHEEEESEPENAYEILEKKRQREIEEWRAQQIASGEAKDNANFQPLGGDWRERVRRKRARKASEAKRSSPEPTADTSQQPYLGELTRDLPSGWQAYWDESTKQVYYGNAITSETTWTRPTS